MKNALISIVLLLAFSNLAFAASKEIRDKIISVAEEQIGQKYEINMYGGWPPGFDCSGLVSYSYLQAGVRGFGWTSPNSHGPNTDILKEMSYKVELDSEVYPGDLVFLHYTYDKYKDGIKENDLYTHVGLYAGNDEIIHAGSPVQYGNLSGWKAKSNFAEVRRIKPEYWPNGENGYVSEQEFQAQQIPSGALSWAKSIAGQIFSFDADGNVEKSEYDFKFSENSPGITIVESTDDNNTVKGAEHDTETKEVLENPQDKKVQYGEIEVEPAEDGSEQGLAHTNTADEAGDTTNISETEVIANSSIPETVTVRFYNQFGEAYPKQFPSVLDTTGGSVKVMLNNIDGEHLGNLQKTTIANIEADITVHQLTKPIAAGTYQVKWAENVVPGPTVRIKEWYEWGGVIQRIVERGEATITWPPSNGVYVPITTQQQEIRICSVLPMRIVDANGNAFNERAFSVKLIDGEGRKASLNLSAVNLDSGDYTVSWFNCLSPGKYTFEFSPTNKRAFDFETVTKSFVIPDLSSITNADLSSNNPLSPQDLGTIFLTPK